MTCACGLGCPSLPMSQCTFMSATMPRSTNCFSTKSRASWTPCCWFSSRGIENSTSRSEEHTSELQSLMRISYAVFCLKKKTKTTTNIKHIIKTPTHTNIVQHNNKLTKKQL